MAGDGYYLRTLATTLRVFARAVAVVSSESSKAGCSSAEHEDKQTCRFNFKSTISTFKSITGWLRSGSFQRTLALS